MSGTYQFGQKSEGIRILQQALADNGFNPGPVDSVFGPATLNAVNDARAAHKLGGTNRVDEDLLRALGIIPSKPIRKPGLLDALATIKTIFDISKGKTMTSDQITGLVRTAVIGLAAYLAGKGYIPAISPELAATIATAIVGVWSWISNRPKVIEPIKK